MAGIDGLLTLLDIQPADGLILAANKAPTLIVGGGKRVLTMPSLDGPTLQALLFEILADDKKAVFEREGAVEVSHTSPRTGAVIIRVTRKSGGLALNITRASHAAPAAEPTAPSAPIAPEPQVVAAPVRSGPATGASPITAVLRQALRRGASDILLSTSSSPAIRLAGEMSELEFTPPTAEELLEFFAAALSPAHARALETTGSADFAFTVGADELGASASRRFRVNLFRHIDGLSAALRPLWETLPSIEALHLPARIGRLVAAQSGLVLLAGLAGSGKSTTLAVLVEHINAHRARHIVTLEDPIEYVFRRRRSVIHQREVGSHMDSFASGLRAALRESPDVILVGEMRDRETISLALTAAETGHLVLSTIHSGSAATAIDRVVDVFPENQQAQARAQLANVLRDVVTQQLLPGRQPGTRVPVLEILTVNHAVASHIREGKIHLIPNQMQVGADDGMLPHDRALADLVRRGLISPSTAVDAARDKDFVTGLLGSPRGPAS
jgi:twitching motility protein PilT